MFIDVKGHHVTITEAIESYVTEKLSRLNTHNHNITTINIFLKVEKDSHNNNHKAEGIIKFKGKHEAYAESITPDMYAAIDSLVDKLDAIAKKQKAKYQSHGNGAEF